MINKLELIKKFHQINDTVVRLKIAEEYLNIVKSESKSVPQVLQYPNYPNDKEVFENIVGFEGIYQIGNWGTFKTLEGFFIKNKKGGKEKMAVYRPETIRKPSHHKRGYPRITLWKNGSVEYWSIHRLVGIYFIPNPDNLPQLCHRDDNPRNPHWTNLFWGTQSDNILDCVAKDRGFVGSKNGNSKLTEMEIPKIRELLNSGKSAYSIAPLFGVAKSQILAIKHGKTWSKVK